MKKLIRGLITVALVAGCAAAMSAPASTADGVLTGPNGQTLYTFDRDAAGSGKSVCNGNCAALWPPLMASDSDNSSGDYTVIVRDDGKKQWAYKGKPLYYYVQDTRPGQKTGDGVNQVWKIAKP